MFTGIIEDVGEVLEIQKSSNSLRMTIRTHIPISEMKEGESISVDGVCLTICGFKENAFFCDVSLETIKVTTLGEKKRGDLVNLERPLKLNDRLHGHIVTGHVECVGTIVDKRTVGDSIKLEIAIPREIARYVVKKGSIAVDGISLTVNDQSDNRFSVNIVPFTAQKTTIKTKRVGEKVNIETDIIGKYVEKLFCREPKGIDYEFLFKYGYIKG
ncbi:MAG: riboflavin synthase [Desulfobacterota bacterium]|nr:riboflavin synthase [Thermodesulfobacteriota bacterium]MDW8002497.1 riboflavin synthase [Deltaproteobacteria bacterium]